MSQSTDDVRAAQWHWLMGQYHRTACELDRELNAEHGISNSEFEVLQQLHNSASDSAIVRLHELGTRVHLTQSALSRLVSRLETAGLVMRTGCADDRRAIEVKITDDGVARLDAATPTQRRVLRDVETQPGSTGIDLPSMSGGTSVQ